MKGRKTLSSSIRGGRRVGDGLRRPTEAALHAIAVDALSTGPGGTLPTSAHYRSRHGFGAGTVQRALTVLGGSDALHMVSHGHQGREIVEIDVGALWRLAGLRRVMIVLPPPGPLEVRGFAEAVTEELGRLDVPFAVSHVRGARSRVEAVASGKADWALVSRGVVHRLDEHPRLAELAIPLGEGTFYAPGRLHVVRRGDWDPSTPPDRTRVAVDYESWDQVALTEAEFPPHEGFRYVEYPFPRTPVAVLRGEADVGVWHDMQVLIPLELAGLAVDTLRRPAARTLAGALSEGVLLVSPGRVEVSALLEYVRLTAVAEQQQLLLAMGPEDLDLYRGSSGL